MRHLRALPTLPAPISCFVPRGSEVRHGVANPEWLAMMAKIRGKWGDVEELSPGGLRGRAGGVSVRAGCERREASKCPETVKRKQLPG